MANQSSGNVLSDLVGGLFDLGNTWSGLGFGQHANQSAQSYSAAVARDLAKQQQVYTYENMTYQQILNSLLMSQQYGYNKSLAELANTYEQGLQSSAFGFDKQLQNLSQQLQAKSADQDYNRAIKYIRDSVTAHKAALLANGYNPILAIQHSIPTYTGHTNAASGGSVGVGSASVPGVSGSSVGLGHGGSGSIGTPGASGLGAIGSALGGHGNDIVRNMLQTALVSSEVEKNTAQANESNQRAATEAAHREGRGSEIKSETFRNYSSGAADWFKGIGSAAGGYWAYNKAKQLMHVFRDGKPSAIGKAAEEVMESVARHGNSAGFGSRLLSAIGPLALGLGPAAGIVYGANRIFGNAGDKNSYEERLKNLPSYQVSPLR